jgi:pectate lyase
VKDRKLTHGGASIGASGVVADVDNVIVSPLTTSLFSLFDLGDGAKWTPRGGTWIDANNQATPLARRQTDKTALARSLTGVPETDDQIIETVARIDSLPPTGDRWVGVIARYRDDANHYYVSLGVNSGLQIRRVAGGAVTVLTSIPYAVHGNVSYRLRFEAVGDQLRAYVNDVFVAEARDATFGMGRFGVATNLAAASFYEINAAQP